MPYGINWKSKDKDRRVREYEAILCRHDIPRSSCIDCRDDPNYQKEIHLVQPEKEE